MYKNIIPILRCPICGEDFTLKEIYKEENEELIDCHLECKNQHLFAVKDGVLDFNSEEQENHNNWSKLYENKDYDSIDKLVEENTPQNEKDLNELAKTYISNYLNQQKPEIIIDIASGRGMLITALASTLNYSPTIICTDLSYEVLKYDRIKMKKLNQTIKFNFIACDCTNIPLKDQSVFCATSFYGIANMMDYALKGIEETKRILKPGARLLNTFITLEKNDSIENTLTHFKQEYGLSYIDKIAFKTDLLHMHQFVFNNINEVLIGSSIGEKRKFDLIPIEGEKFTIAIYEGTK